MYKKFEITPRQSIALGNENDRTIDYGDSSGFGRDRNHVIEDWADEILDKVMEDGDLAFKTDLKESVSQKSTEIYSGKVDRESAMFDSSHNEVSTYAFNLGKAHGRAFEEATEKYDEGTINSIEDFWVSGMHEGVQNALEENNVRTTRTGAKGSAKFESAPVRAAEYLEKGFYSE